MTTKELKSEIQRSLDKVPDRVLKDILEYLKEFEDKPASTIELATALKKMLIQDKKLLERLAK